ncbi:MAG: hypothetical protein OJF59_002421 [Cytophagales bacterium]|jgi:hypothetical protein|nr:hypothetical protein [Bacteroidota bacterium]MBS1980156.1 hypothetical protein [Bacteroidota bacterium]WHZ08667.1 MAG: hypothetical protein OJF59_002421 [Cytophagales bacterium]
MKRFFILSGGLLVMLGLMIGLESCSNPSTTTLPGSWDRMGSFAGIPRQGAVSFVINDIAYVGLGYNGLNNIATAFLTDFWKYDPVADAWYQVASFPGAGRRDAVAFVMNGKAYVGTGYNIPNGVNNPLSDFYQFDPAGGVAGSGAWTRVSDFGVQQDTVVLLARYGCGAFTVNGRGFVGWGNDVNLYDYKDLWEFVPTANSPKSVYPGVWIQRPGAGSKRAFPFIFVINDGHNDMAYVGGGYDQAGGQSYPVDFIRFDVSQLSNSGSGSPWSYLNGLTGKDKNGNAITQPRPRQQASTFSINGYGYITMGTAGGGDTWQYVPAVFDANGNIISGDIWNQYFSITTNVPITGAARTDAVGFTVSVSGKSYGILTTGGNGSSSFDDCWRFDPTGIEPDYK